MGVVAGIFPVIGATTILALFLGAAMRLNQPAIQITHWLAYPLQLAMILPLVRLGEWIVGAPPASFSIPGAVVLATSEPATFLARFGLTGLHGILGWLAVAPLVALVLYRVFLPLLRAARRSAVPKPSRPEAPGPVASETP
jgi:uncharacterized protein (DUF2062 family)